MRQWAPFQLIGDYVKIAFAAVDDIKNESNNIRSFSFPLLA